MADLSLEILLKLLADTHGADQVKAAMDKITAGHGETTEATKKLSSATEELGEKEKEASEFTETLHHNHRALHQVLHVIGNEAAPGMGRALGSALMGPIGIGVAAAFVFEAFKKKIEESGKELDEFADLAAARGKDIHDALRSALLDEEFSPEKTKKYFSELEEALTSYNAAAQHTLEINKELRQIELEKTSAADAQANAQDELRVKQGTMSKEQAEVNRLGRSAAEERAKTKAKEADAQDQINEKTTEQRNTNNAINELENKRKETLAGRPNLIGDVSKEIGTLPGDAQRRFRANAGGFDLSNAGAAATEDYLKSQLEVGKGMIGEDKDGKATGLMALREKAEAEDEVIRNRFAAQIKDAQAARDAAPARGYDVASYQGKVDELKEKFAEWEKTQAKAGEIDKEIQQQRNVNFLIEEKIAALKKSIDDEKELNDKIEDLKKKAEAAAADIETLKTKAANQAAGDASIGASKAGTTEAEQEKAILGYKPPTAQPGQGDLQEELKWMVVNHQLTQQKALEIVKYLVSHADKMQAEYVYLQQQIADISSRTPPRN